MKREQGTCDLARQAEGERNRGFANGVNLLPAVLPVANHISRRDISHRVSTTFRNLIAVFG
jgi:hypothetical protein